MYDYELAVICGRFQPIHSGHQDIIRKALNHAQNVVVYCGSSNNVGTMKNPFSYEDRLKFFETLFPFSIFKDKRLKVLPLNDRKNPADDNLWGKYLMNVIEKDNGRRPDLFVFGNDKERDFWFSKEDLFGIDCLIINKGNIDISGTKLREEILNGRDDLFKKFVDPRLWKYYSFMREKLLKINENKKEEQ